MIARRASFPVLLAAALIAPAALGQEAPPADDEPRGQRSAAAPGLGIDPNDFMLGDFGAPEGARRDDGDGRGFRFHGFLRAPLRLGFGEDAAEGTRVHSPPRVPDESYIDWRFTNGMGGPWVELMLSYGDKKVAGTVSIATYSLTDGGYKDLGGQLGINQAFVSFNYPALFGTNGGLVANVGVFSNRYGAAGRYSAEMYDTYLFGATHVAGEQIRIFVDLPRSFTLHFEEGFGAKLDVPPFIAGEGGEPAASAPYLPYAGPEQQGTTLLAHGHVGFSWRDKLIVGGHLLASFTADADGVTVDSEGEIVPDPEAAGYAPERDGKIINAGADIKLIDSVAGDAYVGYSHLIAEDVVRLAGALEALHSIEGWSLLENYFGEESRGRGTIDSLLFQYTFSLARVLWYPEEFYGQYRDLQLTVFGMYNHVTCDEAGFAAAGMATDRLKIGGEILFTPIKWFGMAARYDVVQPNMDDNTESFHVISPRLFFQSDFVANEQIAIQYSHYVLGSNADPTWPNQNQRPDADVLVISAVMWW